MRKQRSVPWLVVLLLGLWLGGCTVLPAGRELPEERSATLPETQALHRLGLVAMIAGNRNSTRRSEG